MPTKNAPKKTGNGFEVFENIFLPLPPLNDGEGVEIEVYARFMRHYRLIPNSNVNIKVLSAIQFTSDMLDLNDALVSKMLADMGLRGPRRAFPESYLDHVDRVCMRASGDDGGPCASSVDMKRFWDDIGEDKFAPFKKDFPRVEIPARV